jgi:methyltransferase-like protein
VDVLWDDLIEFSLEHKDFLVELLDHLGLTSVDPLRVIARIPESMQISSFKSKLLVVLKRLQFQTFLNRSCNAMLEEDAQALSRQQHQGQRKAIKVTNVTFNDVFIQILSPFNIFL